MKIFNIDDLDCTKFNYSEPKINAMGGQSVYITTDSNEKIIVQTPRCALPFGLNVFEGNQGNKYSLDLSLRGTSVPITKFTKFIQRFDDNNVQQALNNSEVWFKKQLDESVIDELYRSTLKTQKNHAPIMKAKLPTRNDIFLGDIFDQNKNKVDMTCIQKGCSVQAIIECVGMYFVAREFGITWKVIQLKVYPPNRLTGYSFVDEDSDEDVEPVK